MVNEANQREKNLIDGLMFFRSVLTTLFIIGETQVLGSKAEQRKRKIQGCTQA